MGMYVMILYKTKTKTQPFNIHIDSFGVDYAGSTKKKSYRLFNILLFVGGTELLLCRKMMCVM